MSLSDRLAAAAKAREAGGTVSTPATTTSGSSTSTATVERVQVILAASQPVVTVKPDPAAAPDAVCPTCGRTGELGLVDLARRTADWSCESCGAMWRARLAAPADSELPPPSR
jgi:hypothetical protein